MSHHPVHGNGGRYQSAQVWEHLLFRRSCLSCVLYLTCIRIYVSALSQRGCFDDGPVLNLSKKRTSLRGIIWHLKKKKTPKYTQDGECATQGKHNTLGGQSLIQFHSYLNGDVTMRRVKCCFFNKLRNEPLERVFWCVEKLWCHRYR